MLKKKYCSPNDRDFYKPWRFIGWCTYYKEYPFSLDMSVSVKYGDKKDAYKIKEFNPLISWLYHFLRGYYGFKLPYSDHFTYTRSLRDYFKGLLFKYKKVNFILRDYGLLSIGRSRLESRIRIEKKLLAKSKRGIITTRGF